MLQELTIHTENRNLLRPLIESAIETERKMVQLGLQKTRERLVEFEQKYDMPSDEFEQKLNSSDLAETVEFSDWRMEIGMFKLLKRQFEALENARLD